jgi:uncharacterized membrane protein YkvA (DUF1232 family)
LINEPTRKDVRSSIESEHPLKHDDLEGWCTARAIAIQSIKAKEAQMTSKGSDRPTQIFRPGRGGRELSRIEARAASEYAPLYKSGRAKAIERAAELARDRTDEASQADPEQVARDQAKVEAGFWPKLKRVARQVPFLEDLVAAYYAMRDPATPFQARAALAFGLVYFLWVFDIIPDFLGLVGFADDGTVLTTIIVQVGSAITDEHRRQAKEVLGVEG